MYQTYKPSGKVSWVFFPLLLLFLFLFIPSVSYIYVYILCKSPSVILDGILYLLVVYLLALFGTRVCIRPGKVRNLKLAGISGVLAGITFFYAMAACFYLYESGNMLPGKLWEPLAHPGELFNMWKGAVRTGFLVTTVRGTRLFTLRGGLLIAAIVILLLLTVVALVIVFVDTSWYPFCEISKKWASSKTIYLEYIEDRETFIKKLSFGDTSPLQELDVLRSVNCSHSEAELFITDNQADFYITIVNKKKKEETAKDGEVKFEEEDIMELLKLDRRTGEILLARAASGPEQASAKVVTEESLKSRIPVYIRLTLAAVIQGGFLVLCVIDQWMTHYDGRFPAKLDWIRELLSNGLLLYYMVISLIFHALSLIGCFVKEDVIIKKENQLSFHETERYQIERENSPLGYKLYYGVMTLSSILVIAYCLGF